ncbi:MAG: adenylyltransferase/cytidyltransferase family protein [Clostridiales bacterium]|nr:adenylyltransferase/cytidyltransferase family protein [Clostridiales bacterium]
MVIGYTTGVFDLFHIGHLNLLKNAKGMCDKLVVGVTVDELMQYKGKEAMIPFEDRIEIVRACRYVDAAVPQYDMDKLSACKKLGATVLFVGDDWYETDKWKTYEEEFEKAGIRIVYFPYTRGISSTKITSTLKQMRGWTSSISEGSSQPIFPEAAEKTEATRAEEEKPEEHQE